MKRPSFWLVLAVVMICIGCSICLGGDPLPSIESVLAKWEEASQKCRILDAKLAVFRYDVFNGESPKISQGRFYYEAPNIARYEIRDGGNGNVNDWSALAEVLIWNGKETLWIDGSTRKCLRISSAEFETLRDNSEDSLMASIFAALFLRLRSPKEFLPLVIDIRAGDVRERFDVTVERADEEILLKATPKRRADKRLYREIGIVLNAKTFLTSAIQVVGQDKARTVFQLMEQKVNQHPSERDQLIAPDLSALDLTKGVWENGQHGLPASPPSTDATHRVRLP